MDKIYDMHQKTPSWYTTWYTTYEKETPKAWKYAGQAVEEMKGYYIKLPICRN